MAQRHIGFTQRIIVETVFGSNTIPIEIRTNMLEKFNQVAEQSEVIPFSLDEPLNQE